ncbi:MAG: hypothetical protein ACTHMW_10120 [Actinomycetes bacterium]
MSRTTAAAHGAGAEGFDDMPQLIGTSVPEQRGRTCPIDGGTVEHRYETAGIPWFRCRSCGSEMPGSVWQY